MTKAEWIKAEKALSNIYGYVKLEVDGYTLTISLERWGKYSLAIVVYVNGLLKGEWLANDCEERRRFFCKREKSLLNAKQKAIFKKQSKSFQKKFAEEHKLTYTYYEPKWKSFNSMKAHLIKNNNSIKVIEIVGSGE